MIPLRAVAVSGSPRAPSKSKLLAEVMLEALSRQGCETHMVDLATLPADALVARVHAVEVDDAIAAVGRARIVVAASPTYRALYAGVLKCFFDLMPPGHLSAKVCVPVQTAGSAMHFLAVEYGLAPLFASLDGVPIGGVYATDDQFVDGRPDRNLHQRIHDVALAAVALGRVTTG